eukprot:CAMPEP_0172473540 /NCGR_PEP_ID=MMETSP1065-20121228/68907_1 /TAXON_ID=265537 /ORGANISM="Amphiprora paludosa, Strain CCMP125" /LENGTH=463 /DNA_ID=CAMNT_0013231715 /DNA_START=180 /DNA_END=1571 /DNA_ORIENTATION=+
MACPPLPSHCPGTTLEQQYPHTLVWHNTEAGAGLRDRWEVLRHLGNLGALLCARVLVPPPHQALCKRHNGDQRVSKALLWHDLVNYTLLGSSRRSHASPVLLSSWSSSENWTSTIQTGNQSQEVRHFVTDKHETASLAEMYQHVPVLLSSLSSRANWTSTIQTWNQSQEVRHFVTDKHETASLAEMYQHVVKQRQRQRRSQSIQPLVWDIQPPDTIWKFLRYTAQPQLVQMRQEELTRLNSTTHTKTRLPRLTQSKFRKDFCRTYVQQQYPPVLLQLAQTVVQQALSNVSSTSRNTTTTTSFGFLHIRRTDTTQSCNTSLAKMEHFLKCSFSGKHARAYFQDETQPPLLMLVATDEPNITYRHEILALVQQQQSPRSSRIHAVDVDHLIATVLQHEIAAGRLPSHYDNNYTIFLVGRILADVSWFTLAQRRTLECPDCDRGAVEKALRKSPPEDPWRKVSAKD